MMPQDGGSQAMASGGTNMASTVSCSTAAASRSKRVSCAEGTAHHPHQLFHNNSFRSELADTETVLPAAVKARLSDLFYQIEKEFESLYSENLSLQEKIDALNERVERDSVAVDKQGVDATDFDAASSKGFSKHKCSSQKLKTAHKLKAQTSKIVSSFKAATVTCQLVREFRGHRDGVWEVAVSRTAQSVIGTAATDHSACIWSVESGRCLLRYLGHSGSVNSLRFHPTRDLALTASGDQKAHVWQAAVNLELQKASSSDEEGCGPYGDDGGGEGLDFMDKVPSLRTPVCELRGHSSVVIAADWLAPSGDHLVTASWDRTAALWDAQTGEMLHTLAGHDQELTHASAHHSQRLVVTSSRDTTFRLWDFREPIHSVSVFQGHTETVTSAVFTKREDKVVSGSDDRTVKVWDLRNMRSALATIRGDAGVNKLAVSGWGVVAIPYDNRQVRLFDINCPGAQRLARLPRTSRQGHQRMVSSVAWADDSAAVPGMTCNFFSCGFDRLILGWSIQSIKDSKEV
ncbi:WD repeat-containing protein 37 isoform X2 [Nilaparvata lugens]|uniref:WD repeat-containing protein 37 isoform X2 n=1 Tax=Nilaparvata lugens TaxID=108931 RepID=UPI00193DE708|nr:WD repeat-containing protein 37 isoform X2 [Nilaparvata lugens]XP_039281821.1 WD repeat-containing protein 37 isoform X2 [Nilaparvata lugens]